MRFRPTSCAAEVHPGSGPGGVLLRADVIAQGNDLLANYAGQAQTIYLDPPFNTGKRFALRQRVGETGWATGRPTLELPAYNDRWPDETELLALVRRAAELARDLLREDGSLFLHIDERLHAHARLMLDEIFGRRNFVNEIIWAYQSGGRALGHFSRKHDIILFYRKAPKAYFDIRAVGVPRAQARSNHMRRGTDESGRAFRAIVSQGKEYRYYEDDPVFPGDVWDDVSHLQQKDPQRSGYDSQKPLRLLERILLCSTRPGDLACDLFGGSGTTAVAAAKNGRRFLCVDKSPAAIVVSRKRLLGERMRIDAPSDTGAPQLVGSYTPGLGLAQVRLDEYRLEPGLLDMQLGPLDALDQLSVGHLRDGVFHAFESAARTRATPALPSRLELPILEGAPAVLTVDVLGRRLLHVMEEIDYAQ